MKSTLVARLVAGTTLAAAGEWRVGESAVRVICPMTVSGSFDVKTAALSGSVTASPSGSSAFDGSLAVDLRILDTSIDLAAAPHVRRPRRFRSAPAGARGGHPFELASIACGGVNRSGAAFTRPREARRQPPAFSSLTSRASN